MSGIVYFGCGVKLVTGDEDFKQVEGEVKILWIG
jgi:hypothetical protein